MPAPIRVSFAISGEKELLSALSTIEKRVQRLADAEVKAARRSEAATNKRVRAERQRASSVGVAGGGYREAGVNGKSYAQVEREAKAHADRMNRIRERSAIMAGQHATKAANAQIREQRRVKLAEEKAMSARRAGVVNVMRGGARSAMGSITGVAGGLGAAVGGFAVSNAIMSTARLKHQAMGLVSATRDKEGKRTQDPAELAAYAQKMGSTYGVDPSEVLGGLGIVAARAGGAKGLADARKDWDDLTKTAVAYGVSMEDMGGVVAAALDAGVKPGEEMRTLVQDMVAMGKEGAVEFQDLAGELAKLKGAGLSFDMSSGDMLRRMVGMSQIAVRAAVSPEEARTSVKDIGRDIKMKSKYLQDSGIALESGDGRLKDPAVILADTIEMAMTKGIHVPGEKGRVKGSLALGRIFTGTSLNVVEELSRMYREGGGEKGGRAAILAGIEASSGSKLAAGERDAALADTMSTEMQQAKVAFAQFNVEIGKVLPQLMKLAPQAVALSSAFAKFVSFAAENPFAGIGAIFAAAVAKEGAAVALDKILATRVGQIGQIGITAAAVYLAGREIIKEDLNKFSDVQSKLKTERYAAEKLLADPNASPERKAAALESLKAANAAASKEGVGFVAGMAGSVASAITGDESMNPELMAARNQIEADKLIAALDAQIKAAQTVSENESKVATALASFSTAVDSASAKLKSVGDSRDGKPPARK